MAFNLTHVLRTLLNLDPPDPDAVLMGPRSTTPHTVKSFGDTSGAPRVMSAPDAALVVGVAHHSQSTVLTELPHFSGGAGYALLAPGTLAVPEVGLRPGESLDAACRTAQHCSAPPAPFEQVLLVGPADPYFCAFGRDETVAVQWLLHELARRAGRAQVYGALPQRPVLLDHEPGRLTRWVHDLAPMLRSATSLFEPAAGVLLPQTLVEAGEAELEPQGVARGYRIVLPPGLTEAAEARRYALAWRGLEAKATKVGNWIVLHGGAAVDPIDHPGVQACIAAKRRDMCKRGVLQQAGAVLRLTCDVAVPSLTNAARVVTGTNGLGHLWQRLT